MTKKVSFKWQIGICCIIATIVFAILFLLYFNSVISIVPLIMILSLLILLLLSSISIILILRKAQQIKIIQKKRLEIAERNKKLKEIYGILGLEIQYDENGSVKDIFSLLHLKPKFDKNGKRVLTPYELLKINPRFDENGNEIPSVFIIKNRINKVTRRIAEAPSFKFKPKIKEVQKPQEEQKNKPVKKENKTGGKKAKNVSVQTNIKAGKTKNKPATHSEIKASKSADNVNEQPKIKLSIPKLIPKIVKVFHEQDKNKSQNIENKTDKIANKEKRLTQNSYIGNEIGRVKPAHNAYIIAQSFGETTFVLKSIYVNKNLQEQSSFLFIEEIERGL